jgi:hypothetical protein
MSNETAHNEGEGCRHGAKPASICDYCEYERTGRVHPQRIVHPQTTDDWMAIFDAGFTLCADNRRPEHHEYQAAFQAALARVLSRST